MNAYEIGKRLRDMRGERTLTEVADAIGIGVSTLTMYELGERIPRDIVKVRLAEYYGVTVQDLFFCTTNHDS